MVLLDFQKITPYYKTVIDYIHNNYENLKKNILDKEMFGLLPDHTFLQL